MIFHFKIFGFSFYNFFRFLIVALTLSALFFPTNALAQYVCEKGDCVNGIGKKKVLNSKSYMEGRFVDGVFKEGDVLFPNGDFFQGKFKNNKLVEGKKIFKNGKTLEGEFFEDVFIKGKVTEADGSSRYIRLKRLN